MVNVDLKIKNVLQNKNRIKSVKKYIITQHVCKENCIRNISINSCQWKHFNVIQNLY